MGVKKSKLCPKCKADNVVNANGRYGFGVQAVHCQICGWMIFKMADERLPGDKKS